MYPNHVAARTSLLLCSIGSVGVLSGEAEGDGEHSSGPQAADYYAKTWQGQALKMIYIYISV